MRVAALYDIHGNLPALEAVLDDVRQANVDHIVIGGDVLPGPMPVETLERLLHLEWPTEFIYGNGERAILAHMEGERTGSVTYWGTITGARPPESIVDIFRWSGAQLPEFESVLTQWPKTIQFEVDGLGQVLFCHSTPRSETECFLKTTAEDRLLPLFEPLNVSLIVCGHSHMQFDRKVGKTRVVNAGSVGMPFAEAGAYWLLLGPDVQLRRTLYDFSQAAERVRRTKYPQVEEFAAQILSPPSEEKMLAFFAPYELTP